MASKAMVTYCISTTWHRSRSLLSWRFLVWPKFTFISYVLTLLLSGSTCTKKLGFALNWRLRKDSFWGKIKEGQKRIGTQCWKIYQKCLISNSENETFWVEFHALCLLINVSLPYSHPKSLLFSLMRRRWKEALMRFWVHFSCVSSPILWPKAALLSTIGNCT